MAWKAIITGWNLDGPDVTVGYYDDATPPDVDGSPVVLYSQSFRRAEVANTADLRAQVIATAFGVPSQLVNMPIEGGLNYQTPILLLEQWWRQLWVAAWTGHHAQLAPGAHHAAVGLLLGLAMAAGIGKLASGLLYRVSPFDPIVLTTAAVVLTSAALLASYLPARRATRIVPLDALRSE